MVVFLHSATNVIMFGDCKAHHVKWFHQSNTTDVVGVQSFNSSVAQAFWQSVDLNSFSLIILSNMPPDSISSSPPLWTLVVICISVIAL